MPTHPWLRHALGLALGVVASLARAGDPAPWVVASVDDPLARSVQPILERAYGRIGRPIQFQTVPLQRATRLLQLGQIDAEMLRADAYFQAVPEALKVPVALATTRFMVYQRPPCPARVDPATLAAAGVLYVRGVRAVEEALPKSALLPVGREADLFPLLLAGRAPYVVAATAADQLPVPAVWADQICRVPEPFMSRALFHAVHRRHAALVAPLAAALSAELPAP